MIVSVKRWLNAIYRAEPKRFEESQPQFHFGYQNSNVGYTAIGHRSEGEKLYHSAVLENDYV